MRDLIPKGDEYPGTHPLAGPAMGHTDLLEWIRRLRTGPSDQPNGCQRQDHRLLQSPAAHYDWRKRGFYHSGLQTRLRLSQQLHGAARQHRMVQRRQL